MIRAIGIDVHKDSYSISAFDPQTTNFSAETTVAADSKSVITYLKRLKKEIAAPVTIEIGYEAGPTGFGLKRDLEKAGYTCHVMAPTSIYRPAAGVKVKTDERMQELLRRLSIGALTLKSSPYLKKMNPIGITSECVMTGRRHLRRQSRTFCHSS